MNEPHSSLQPATLITHAGRPKGCKVTVNPVVARTSTVVFDSMATLRQAVAGRARHETGLVYGRKGSPTGESLEAVICALEGGHRSRLFSSGLAAITCAILSVVRSGDHVLVVDSCYEPVRKFCVQYLQQMGVECSFFQPDLSDLKAKIRPNTRLIWTESPGSILFEMCDLPALVALAKAHDNVVVAVDNTWGSGLMYCPLRLGADMSVIAATKYLVGHSDVMLGAVTTNQNRWTALADMGDLLGHCVSPDDAYLALRGVRTLSVRMRQQQDTALQVAHWLQKQALISTVFYPALPDDPGHAIWKRDFSGANGLLSCEFRTDVSAQAVDAFVETLQLFGIGHSWGGYESLALPVSPAAVRSLSHWQGRGNVVRLHVGLEDPADLIHDLQTALARLGEGLAG